MIKPEFFCSVCGFELDSDAFDEYYEDERNVCIRCRLDEEDEEFGEEFGEDFDEDADFDDNDFEEDEEE